MSVCSGRPELGQEQWLPVQSPCNRHVTTDTHLSNTASSCPLLPQVALPCCAEPARLGDGRRLPRDSPVRKLPQHSRGSSTGSGRHLHRAAWPPGSSQLPAIFL